MDREDLQMKKLSFMDFKICQLFEISHKHQMAGIYFNFSCFWHLNGIAMHDQCSNWGPLNIFQFKIIYKKSHQRFMGLGAIALWCSDSALTLIIN